MLLSQTLIYKRLALCYSSIQLIGECVIHTFDHSGKNFLIAQKYNVLSRIVLSGDLPSINNQGNTAAVTSYKRAEGLFNKKNMAIKVKIEKVENGYLMTYDEPVCDDNNEEAYRDAKEVIEEGDDETVAMKKLLEWVAEFFGFTYDKYGEHNLRISFDKKGHKIDDSPEEE